MHSHLNGHPSLIQAVKRLEQLNPDQFELYFVRKANTSIECKDQKVDSLTRSEDVGLSVRILKDRRLGFSFTTSLDDAAIDRAVQSASEVASAMPEDEFANLHSFANSAYPEVDSRDNRGLAAPLSQKIELAKQLEAACRAADPRIKGVRKATVGETAYEVHMVDSSGEHIEHRSSVYSASITCKSEQDGDNQIGGEWFFSNYLDNLDVVTAGKNAARFATELLGAKSAPTMKCPAVFRNDVMANLVEMLAASFSAEEIDKGRSMLAGKFGKRVFSEQVTLIDDGLLPGGFSTSPFDAEGIPSTKTTLVDGGFVSAALYDLYYAKKKGAPLTGSSVRGLKSPPSIGFTNLFLKPGRKSLEQLQLGISKGIMITDLMGIHTANPITGDFSLGASGILIENGKLTTPVRGFAVAGNVLEILRCVVDVGSDFRFFGNVGAASARIAEISVGGS